MIEVYRVDVSCDEFSTLRKYVFEGHDAGGHRTRVRTFQEIMTEIQYVRIQLRSNLSQYPSHRDTTLDNLIVLFEIID